MKRRKNSTTIKESFDKLEVRKSNGVKYYKTCHRDYELHHIQNVPSYLKHNEYIHHGYRADIGLIRAFKSLFHWHNETINVWTHLIGFIFFFVLAIITLSVTLRTSHSSERFVSTIFLVSSMIMMLFSSIFHLFCCSSQSAYTFTAKLDYSGIGILIVGSFYPFLYYLFYCDDVYHLRVFYTAAITILGLISLIVVWFGSLHEAGGELLRLAVFIGLGFFALIPIPHALYIYGEAALPYVLNIIYSGSIYIAGSVIYAKKYPESLFPGKFDSIFASHNIWHLFVMAGAFTHFLGMLSGQEWRRTTVCM